jgi:hypothetical protein
VTQKKWCSLEIPRQRPSRCAKHRNPQSSILQSSISPPRPLGPHAPLAPFLPVERGGADTV